MDNWQQLANRQLVAYAHHATERGMDYSPDTTYEQLKRGHCGRHSVEISKILHHWAALWAEDMRTLYEKGMETDLKRTWFESMAQADAEIERYLKPFNLTLKRAA